MDTGESYYRRYLDGDEGAFDGVLKLYYDNLVFFLNRYVKDPSAAEDLTMDAFLELLIHPARYNFKTSLKTYLFTIGRNKALNYLKKHRWLRPAEIKDHEGVSASLETDFVIREERLELSKALAKLPADMRIAVHLVYFEEMSYEDAAKVMKKTRKQVDNLLFRAKTTLKKQLNREVIS